MADYIFITHSSTAPMLHIISVIHYAKENSVLQISVLK